MRSHGHFCLQVTVTNPCQKLRNGGPKLWGGSLLHWLLDGQAFQGEQAVPMKKVPLGESAPLLVLLLPDWFLLNTIINMSFLCSKSHQFLGFPSGSVKNPPAMQKVEVQFLGQESLLEKEMATHSSIPAWEIPRTKEPCWLQSMGSQESDTTKWLSRRHRHQFLYASYSITGLWLLLLILSCQPDYQLHQTCTTTYRADVWIPSQH